MHAEADIYLRALRARWWLVVVVVLAAVAAARYLTMRELPVYRATASATVTPSPEVTATADLLRALETLERRTVLATIAQLPGSRAVNERAADALGLEEVARRAYEVSASVVPNTNVLQVHVEGPDPFRASELANAVTRATADEAGRLYRLFVIAPLDPAIAPPHAVRPNAMRNAVVAGVLGLFLGVVVTVGLEALASLAVRTEPPPDERHARPGVA